MKGSWEQERDPLAALARGDPSLFEAFVAAETRTFVGFFRGLGADLQEAEDLAQELFMKLYATSATYRPSERFGAFAFRVARNAWIDRGRRRAARIHPRPLEPEGSGEGPDAPRAGGAAPPAGAALRDEADWIRRAVRDLPEGQRTVFELGVVQELPYPEIASALGIPVGTVKSRMHHAVRRVREALAPRQRPGAAGEARTGRRA